MFLINQRIQITVVLGEAGSSHQCDYDYAEHASLFAEVSCVHEPGLSNTGV